MNAVVLLMFVLSTFLTPVELRAFVVADGEGLSNAQNRQTLKLNHLSGKHASLVKSARAAVTPVLQKHRAVSPAPVLLLGPGPRHDVSDPTLRSICHHFSIPPPRLRA